VTFVYPIAIKDVIEPAKEKEKGEPAKENTSREVAKEYGAMDFGDDRSITWRDSHGRYRALVF